MFMIFLRTEFPIWLQKACAFIAPSVFMVYLLHSGCNPTVSGPLFKGFLQWMDKSFEPVFMHRVWAVIFGGCIVFAITLGVDLLRRTMVLSRNDLRVVK